MFSLKQIRQLWASVKGTSFSEGYGLQPVRLSLQYQRAFAPREAAGTSGL